MYENGNAVEQDYAKAMEYYQREADLGEPYGYCSIGSLYAKGLGVAQDYEKAAEYYRKSSELGEKDAVEYLKELVEAGHVSGDYLEGLGE